MTAWHEEQHPRDDEGQFTEKWASGLSVKLSRILARHKPVVGRDISTLDGEIDWEAAHEAARGSFTERVAGDPWMEVIYKRQGFHGKPQVLGPERFRAAVKAGARELWRGVEGTHIRDRWVRESDFVEDFRSGKRHYPGWGIHGNGTYATTERSTALSYARGNEAGLIHLALRPDANAVTHSALNKEWADVLRNFDLLPSPDRSDSKTQARRNAYLAVVLGDVGRFAAARGYDAIIDEGGEGIHIILNRTAVIVEKPQ